MFFIPAVHVLAFFVALFKHFGNVQETFSKRGQNHEAN